jgi:hypothetical protein
MRLQTSQVSFVPDFSNSRCTFLSPRFDRNWFFPGSFGCRGFGHEAILHTGMRNKQLGEGPYRMSREWNTTQSFATRLYTVLNSFIITSSLYIHICLLLDRFFIKDRFLEGERTGRILYEEGENNWHRISENFLNGPALKKIILTDEDS